MRPCIQSFCTDHRRSAYVFGQIAGIATGADPNLTEEAAALLRHRQQHTGAEISRCVSPLQQILPGNLFFPLPEGLPPPPLLPHHYFDYSLYLAFLSALMMPTASFLIIFLPSWFHHLSATMKGRCKLMSWLAHCMDAGRRQETLGSETKDFVTHHPVGSMSFMSATVSLVPPHPQVLVGR